jgi:predicted ATPase
MIRKLTIKDVSKSAIPHFGACQGLPKSGDIEFNPKLTVLWGNNGSGQSTLLLEIARRLHCEQGGAQKVTRTSCANMEEKQEGDKSGVVVDHDGGPIFFFDPAATVGLFHGALDHDFGSEGIANVRAKGSAGETTVFRGVVAYDCLFKGTELPKRGHTYGYSPKDVPRVHKFLTGTPDAGVAPTATLLIDEGERSLSLVSQAMFWETLYLRVHMTHLPALQVIVATHSIFALGWAGVKYIETTPGSITETTQALLQSSVVYNHLRKLRKHDV